MDLAIQQKHKELRSQKTSQLFYEGRVITVCQETFFFEGEQPFKTDLILHPGAATVLPIDDRGELLLIKQWRRASGDILIEAPAGILETHETVAECAMRELREETGFAATTLTQIGKIYTAPGFCNEVLHLFIAEGLVEDPLPKDTHENIDLFSVSLTNALDMIETGVICDAKTIVLILRYARSLL
ncbi:MAG: NUDIX hydrolase [Simkania sp.]|nr:NUDIX hydrolase [Simkania sp.]